MTIAEGNNRYRQILKTRSLKRSARKAAREIAGQKERRFLVSEVKWVVVERQNMSGRYVALPGVSYPTQAEAEAHILERFDPSYHDRYHVDDRGSGILLDPPLDRLARLQRLYRRHQGHQGIHFRSAQGEGQHEHRTRRRCYGN